MVRLRNLAGIAFAASLVFVADGCSGESTLEAPVGSEAASTPEAGTSEPDRVEPKVEPCAEDIPRPTPVTIGVLPAAGEAVYVDLIRAATKSIRVFAYQMGFGGTLDALTERAQSGIDVRVILDGQSQLDVNEKYRVRLEAAGAKVVWSDPAFSYMHAKAIVIDDREAVVSTGNYSKSYLLKERNFVARFDDVDDIADLIKLFEADWTKSAVDLSCTRLVVSPINAKERIVKLLKSARTSIEIESMQFGDDDVREAVFERAAAGVAVRVILAAPSWIDANENAGIALKEKKIAARWLKAPSIHAKAIVVDGVRSFVGSENLSWTSLTKNREIGVVVVDSAAVNQMRSTFEADWPTATDF